MSRSSIFRLAVREYWQAWRKPLGRTPGGRDFLRLSFLIALVAAIANMAGSVEVGLLNRMGDSLIGRMGDHGFPVLLLPGAWHDSIDRQTLGLFANYPGEGAVGAPAGGSVAAALDIYPLVAFGIQNDPLVNAAIREFGAGPERDADPNARVRLLGGGAAGADGLPAAAPLPADVQGWAVLTSDPLWQWAGAPAADPGALPLTLVLSRAVFAADFDLAAYRDALDRALPPALTARDAQAATATGLDHLWLGLRTGEAVRFDVRWVDSFPGIADVGMLVPLETYLALKALDGLRGTPAGSEAQLYLGPAGEGAGIRYRELRLREGADVADAGTRDTVARFAHCLGAGVEIRRIDYVLTPVDPSRPVTAELLDLCRTQVGQDLPGVLDPDEVRGIAAGFVAGGYVTVPCAIAVDAMDFVTEDDRALCRDGAADRPVRYDAFRDGFTRAVAYVQDRAGLTATVGALSAITGDGGHRVFFFAPTYQASLDRYTFLSATLDWLKWPLMTIAAALGIYLLALQIGTVTEHRRQQYGLLLAIGCPPARVAAMVAAQILLSTIVGTAIGGGLAEGLKLVVNASYAASDAMALGTGALGIRDSDLLPFGILFPVGPAAVRAILDNLVLMGVLSIAALLTLFFITRLRFWLNRCTTPAGLMQAEGEWRADEPAGANGPGGTARAAAGSDAGNRRA